MCNDLNMVRSKNLSLMAAKMTVCFFEKMLGNDPLDANSK